MSRLIIGGIAAALLAAALLACYLLGRSHGAEKVQGRWDAEKIVVAEAFQKQVQATETIEAERDQALQEISRELEPALQAATDRVAGLARRLRDYQNRADDCPVSKRPTPAPGDSSPRGVPDSALPTERALDELLAAAARDSARLTACQTAYERVRAAR